MEKCMLCRGTGPEVVVDNLNPYVKKTAGKDLNAFNQFEKWAEHCINSMCRLLKVPKDHPLKTVLLNAGYCTSCTQLIRNIDLTLKQLDSLQVEMVHFRDELASKVKCNYEKISNLEDIVVTYEDVGNGNAVPHKQEPLMFDEAVKIVYEKTEYEKTRWTTSDFMRHQCTSIKSQKISNAEARDKCQDLSLVFHIKEEIVCTQYEDFDAMPDIPDVIIPEVSTISPRERKTKKNQVHFAKYKQEDRWDDEGLDIPADNYEAYDLEGDNDCLSDPDWNEEISPRASSTSKLNSGRKKIRNQPQKLICCKKEGCTQEFQTRKSMLAHVSEVHEESSVDSDSTGSDSDDSSWSKAGSKKNVKGLSKSRAAKRLRLKQPFNCSEIDCEKIFRSEERMLAHVRKIHRGDPTPYHCINCDLKYEARDKLDWHIKTSHGIIDKNGHDSKKTFKCTESTCTTSFSSEYELLIHQRKIHEGDTHPFHCDECDDKFSSENKLKYHKTKHKAAEGGAICPICNKSFTTVSGMKSHQKRAHTNQELCKKCSFCGILKTSDEELEIHEAEHKKREVPFSCLECDQHFTSSTDLISHMVNHDDTRWMCDICGLLLATQRNLRAHRKVHDESFTKFQCQECGLKCASRAVLERHSARHTNERKHVCEKCGKSYKYSSALLVHTRRHNNINPFKCKICGKGFIASHYMKKHEQIHSGILAYQCKVCGKRFRAQSNLYQHERIHGPDNPNKKPRVRANNSKRVPTDDGSSISDTATNLNESLVSRPGNPRKKKSKQMESSEDSEGSLEDIDYSEFDKMDTHTIAQAQAISSSNSRPSENVPVIHSFPDSITSNSHKYF